MTLDFGTENNGRDRDDQDPKPQPPAERAIPVQTEGADEGDLDLGSYRSWRQRNYRVSNVHDQIADGLYLGREHAILDQEFLREAGITAILSVTEDPLSGEHRRSAIEVGIAKFASFSMVDDFDARNAASYEKAVKQLVRWMEDGERVLVHCHAGRSRSPQVVVGFLMLTEGMSQSDARHEVSTKRVISISKGVQHLPAVFSEDGIPE